mgnify:CR=1 FL=1
MMIIKCINCSKKFQINSDLIPSEGRTIQCGSCNYVWFFKKEKLVQNIEVNESNKINIQQTDSEEIKNIDQLSQTEITEEDIKIPNELKQTKIINEDLHADYFSNKTTKSKHRFSFVKLLSLLLVIIITFIGLLIVLDTFKTPLYNIFPKLEFFLFNLFETLIDVKLFIKDLF